MLIAKGRRIDLLVTILVLVHAGLRPPNKTSLILFSTLPPQKVSRCILFILEESIGDDFYLMIKNLTSIQPILIFNNTFKNLIEGITLHCCFKFIILSNSNCSFLDVFGKKISTTRARGEAHFTFIVNGDQQCVVDFTLRDNLLNVTIINSSKSTEISEKTLHGKTLNVSVISYSPFIYFPENILDATKDVNLQGQMLSYLDGIEYRMLQYLSTKFNFTMNITLRQELELWGTVYSNGTATGSVGMIRDGLIDLAAGGFNLDLRYISSTDLTQPYRKTLVKFLSPFRESTPTWMSLVYPFKIDTWCAICAVVLAGALSLFAAQYAEDTHTDLSLSCLISLSVLTQQGDFSQQWLRGMKRPILLGLQVAMLLLSACYSGLLVSVLTFEPPAQQIDTPEQLANSKLKYTDVDDVFPGQLLLSEDPHIQKILQRLDMSYNWEDLKFRLLAGHSAYTAECLDTGFICLQEHLDPGLLDKLHLSREFVLASEIALLVSKGFPLRHAFDREISHLVESGILMYWEKYIMTLLPDQDTMLIKQRRSKRDKAVALSRSHLGGPFALLGFGLALASLIFCYEILPRNHN